METNRVQLDDKCLRSESGSTRYSLLCPSRNLGTIWTPCNPYRIFYHLYNCNATVDTHSIYLVSLFSTGEKSMLPYKIRVMKKCVLSFIVLVFTLVLAVITDDNRSLIKEGTLTKHNMGDHVDIAQHKTLSPHDYLLRGK